MKKLVLLGTAVLAFASCQQSAKIAYVDNSKLINEYQEKKDIEASLKVKIDAFQKRTDSLQKAFQFEVNEAEIKARRLSGKALQELSNDIQDKNAALQQRFQFEQGQIAQESQSKNDSLVKKVKTFIKDYGTKHGYEFILGSNEGGSVMFGKTEHDLTETLLELLNTEYKKQ
ncbi:MAG: OmpH family outer membrane protein [Flavobacteriaceae bacterium]|nr:OmpH family outer membrane protein [Flavobacteriaceae bacterium]